MGYVKIPQCRNCGEYADDCPDECEMSEFGEHDFPTETEQRASLTVSVAFECGHSVSLMKGSRIPDSCPACAIGIPEGMTQCEDYPCCGHTDGDGCIPRPEHTSEYWHEMYSRLDGMGLSDEEIDLYMTRGDDY